MEVPPKMELRHWANFDQTYLKDFFRESPHTKLTEIMAERDAHLAERDKAIAEKKNAYAERNTALLQRDLAYAERNAAWMERDSAIKALHMIQTNENDQESSAKIMQMMHFIANRPSGRSNYLSTPNALNETFSNNMVGVTKHTETGLTKKQSKDQQAKKAKIGTSKRHKPTDMLSQDKKVLKASGRKRKQHDPDGPLGIEKFNHQDSSRSIVSCISPYDLLSTPVPLCSCTGTNKRCYRWGNGGWQSACCTKFMSMYPLPMHQVKSGSRVPGRKMSGSAFGKLLEKLAGLGVDITKPIDLKNHWAKHGTNRYVTIQ